MYRNVIRREDADKVLTQYNNSMYVEADMVAAHAVVLKRQVKLYTQTDLEDYPQGLLQYILSVFLVSCPLKDITHCIEQELNVR